MAAARAHMRLATSKAKTKDTGHVYTSLCNMSRCKKTPPACFGATAWAQRKNVPFQIAFVDLGHVKNGSTLSEESLVDVRLVRAVTALTLSGIFPFFFSFSFLVVIVVAVVLARSG